ncbi:cyclase/dehydrase [Nitzschia inconspicua]|uniref:Cyclase/dehydrase n=1 Tax=Nitzschia inconspicua TaxID=303405 RepID=A0A9K3KWE1_9STRA|nr:cyclase/dehydrase [Nitzschia inconspicua]
MAAAAASHINNKNHKRRFSSSNRRRRPLPHDCRNRNIGSWVATVLLLCISSSCWNVSTAFILTSPSTTTSTKTVSAAERQRRLQSPTNIATSHLTTSARPSCSSTTTALNVWWFGGTEQSDNNNNDSDSCELVAVRIERTSPNSRRIAGEISVPAPLESVWSILTDYNRLAIHVPNLMESKIVRENGPGNPGDGSYKCRLYQVGAQKIIGFDFSASVTMDMSERIIASSVTMARKIDFKCVDSQFFSEFDGAWTVKEQRNPATGEVETLCSYVVDVRPKGPVPVAALEWRIREDVPTNLRAVKAATLGMNSVTTTTRIGKSSSPTTTTAASRSITQSGAATTKASSNSQPKTKNSTANRQVPVRLAQSKASSSVSQPPRVPAPRLASILMDWDVDETMGKYL